MLFASTSAHSVRAHFSRGHRGFRPQFELLENRVVLTLGGPITMIFDADQAQSFLSLSGDVDGNNIQQQGAGSLTSFYSGTITAQVDYGANTIHFPAGGSSLDANVSGNWQPGPGGTAGQFVAADYGGFVHIVIIPFIFEGDAFVAVRGAMASLSTGAPQSLSGAGATRTFASNQNLEITQGVADYDASDLGQGGGSESLAGNSGVNASGTSSSIVDLGGGHYRLTISIALTIVADVSGLPATLNLNGQVIADAFIPVVDLNGAGGGNDHSASYTEDNPPALIVDAAMTVTRTGGGNLASAVIELNNPLDGANEILDLDVGASGLVENYSNGTLTLTGVAPLSTYEAVLRTATYVNNSQNPNPTARTVQFQVSDGTTTSVVRTTTVTVVGQNDQVSLDPIADDDVDEAATLSFTVSVTDPDLPFDTMTYTLDTPLANASIHPTSGQFSFTPDETQGGQVFLVTVRVTDSGLSFDTKSFNITVNEINQQPLINFVADQQVDETGTLSFTITANDPDVPADTLTWSLDNPPAGATIDPGTGLFSWTPDDGPSQSITITVMVEDNGTPVMMDMKSFLVTVNNVGPTATLSNNGSVNENSGVIVSFTNQADASPADTLAGFTYSYDFNNDGDFLDGGDIANTAAPNAAHTFTDNGTFVVRGRIMDKDGGFTDYTTTVTVNNIAPTASLSNNGPVAEGSSVTVSFSGETDPSPNDSAAGFLYSYDFNNDGDYVDAGDVLDSTADQASFAFADNGVFTVTGRIRDKDGGATESTTQVTVTSVAPTAILANNGPTNEGQPVSITFSNQLDPSTTDTASGFLYSFDLNNDGDFTDPGDVAAGTSSSVSATFQSDGTYTVGGRIQDKDGDFTDYTTQFTIFNIDAIVTSFDKGGSTVRVLDAVTRVQKFSFAAYDALFKGGCQVALGDVNGDGVPDIITGPGPGGNAALRTNSIKVFDGNNGTILAGPFDNLQPFGATFKKGYWISAGDFNGDDQADIVLSARGGFAPTVRVIDGATGGMLFEVTTAFPATYKKGVRTAVADVTDDGTPDIVMASGAKTTSLVKVFDGSALTLVGGGLEFNPFGDLPTVKSGVFVAAGDVNGDGNADIITGVMKGAPALRVFDGLTGQKIGELIPAEGPLYKGGIRVGSFDVDSDGDMDIITSTGKAKGVFAHVRTLDGQTLNEIDNFFAQQANIFKGGVFVAGGR